MEFLYSVRLIGFACSVRLFGASVRLEWWRGCAEDFVVRAFGSLLRFADSVLVVARRRCNNVPFDLFGLLIRVICSARMVARLTMLEFVYSVRLFDLSVRFE